MNPINSIYSNKTFKAFLQKESHNASTPINTEHSQSKKDNVDIFEKKQSINKKFIGYVSAATAGGALLIALGVGAIKHRNVKGLLEFFDKQLNNLKLQEKTSFIHKYKQKFYIAAKKVVTGVTKLSASLSISKDIHLVQTLKKLDKEKGLITKSIDLVTDLFKSIAKRAAQKKYKKALKRFEHLENTIDKYLVEIEDSAVHKMDIKIPEHLRINSDKHLAEINLNQGENTINRAKKIKDVLEQIKTKLQSLADEDNFNKRFEELNKNLDDVVDDFLSDYENVVNKASEEKTLKEKFSKGAGELVNVFTEDSKQINAERHSEGLQKEFKRRLFDQKEEISRSVVDNHDRVKELLSKTRTIINDDSSYDYKQLQEIFKNVNSNLEKYKLGEHLIHKTDDQIIEITNSDKCREVYKNNIHEALEKLQEMAKGKASEEVVNKRISQVKLRLNDDKKGLVEELRELLKCNDLKHDNIKEGSDLNLLKQHDESAYFQLKEEISSFTRSLKKATKFETNNMFERVRDLELGAAPLELLGLIVPIPYFISQMAKAKDPEEQKATALSKGVPLVGAMGAWIYGAMFKLLNAPQTMAFSLISGAIFTNIGNGLKDKLTQHKSENQKEFIS